MLLHIFIGVLSNILLKTLCKLHTCSAHELCLCSGIFRSAPRTIKKKPDPVNHPEYEEEEDIKTFPPDGFTVWDKVVIQEGDLTVQVCRWLIRPHVWVSGPEQSWSDVQEFLDFWKTKHGLTCRCFLCLSDPRFVQGLGTKRAFSWALLVPCFGSPPAFP
jgi:hypothetical protein